MAHWIFISFFPSFCPPSHFSFLVSPTKEKKNKEKRKNSQSNWGILKYAECSWTHLTVGRYWHRCSPGQNVWGYFVLWPHLLPSNISLSSSCSLIFPLSPICLICRTCEDCLGRSYQCQCSDTNNYTGCHTAFFWRGRKCLFYRQYFNKSAVLQELCPLPTP